MIKHIFSLLFLAILLCCKSDAFCQTSHTEIGIASYYHDMFVGRKTATGEIFSQEKMTAAHKSLPLNSWVRVTNLKNDSVVVLRINDRMPQWNKRSIDLTEAAASKLDYLHSGLAKVKIEVISDPTKNTLKKFILDTNQVITKMDLCQLNALQIESQQINLKFPKIYYYNFPQLSIKEKLLFHFSKKG